MNALANVYGTLLIVRPPVPATCNKAGANYKSEVAHTMYSPRRAYREWLSICDAIVACGGDALFDFEPEDDAYIDRGDLRVDADGAVLDKTDGDRVGHLDELLTGRVFTANGPWVVVDEGTMRAVMPNMLAHRRAEAPYYRNLLARIAELGGYSLDIADNPHRWEGMADVAVVGDEVVLTYAVPGHYDEGTEPKSKRSSREGVAHAADFVGVPDDARVFAELIYPHFHGDTVHFGARPTERAPALVHYPGGLWGDFPAVVRDALGADNVLEISRDDAVEQYAGNSRQVGDGVLIPDRASNEYAAMLLELGLQPHAVPLFELFGKAGGGPACATLYMPKNLEVPADAPIRYSVRRDEAHARASRIAETLSVDPAYFEGKARG
jgi:N-dimethylarginine dimethylaminohydrolase